MFFLLQKTFCEFSKGYLIAKKTSFNTSLKDFLNINILRLRFDTLNSINSHLRLKIPFHTT